MVERLGDIFLRKVYNFFFKKFLLLKSELYSGRRKHKTLEAKLRGANWLDLPWLEKISTSWQCEVYAAKKSRRIDAGFRREDILNLGLGSQNV